MKKYIVTIQRVVDYQFEIDAEDEFEAEEKAEDEFDKLNITGQEMYTMYNNTVEELKDSDD